WQVARYRSAIGPQPQPPDPIAPEAACQFVCHVAWLSPGVPPRLTRPAPGPPPPQRRHSRAGPSNGEEPLRAGRRTTDRMTGHAGSIRPGTEPRATEFLTITAWRCYPDGTPTDTGGIPVRRLAVLLALILFATSAVAAPAPLRKPPKKEAEKPVERKLGINF